MSKDHLYIIVLILMLYFFCNFFFDNLWICGWSCLSFLDDTRCIDVVSECDFHPLPGSLLFTSRLV